jgi:parvulin-like peptidyl-prolyl isomerase
LSMKTRIVMMATVALLALGLSGCRNNSFKEITSQELTTMADSMPPQAQRQLAENEKQRQEIIKKVKEIFALAQAAQAAGVDKTEKFKQQLEIQMDQVLAEAEARKSAEGENKKPSEVPEAELTAYADSHTKEYDALIKAMTEGQKEQPSKEQIDGMKKSWAEIKIRADRARKAGLEKDPGVQLQLKLQQAQILAGAYQESMEEKIKPTPEELKEYYQTNPDADPENVKKKAEEVLARVKKGEDFAELAKQFSIDGSAAQGGLMRWFGKGRMVPEFEASAFGMQKGQTSDLVKTKFGYHIIRVEDKATRKPEKGKDDTLDDKEQELILARHILISTNAVDEAENKLKQKKMTRIVEDATLKYAVAAPNDFVVNVKGLRATETPNLQLPGGGGGTAAPATPAPSAAPEKK